jgi:hypothetical protein
LSTPVRIFRCSTPVYANPWGKLTLNNAKINALDTYLVLFC